MSSKIFWQITILIAIAAFSVRASVLWATSPMVTTGDEPEYVALAKALLTHKQFVNSDFIQTLYQGGKPGDKTAFRSPVLPFFLAAHYALFGDSDVFPRTTLILMAAFVCVFLAWCGRAIASPLAGLIAAATWAFYPTSVWSNFSSDRYYPEGISIFLLVGGFTFLLAFYRQNDWWKIVLAGLLLGFTVLTRGYLAFVIPFVSIFLLLTLPTRKWQTATVFTLLVAFIIGGWTLRNWVAVGKLTLSTQTDGLYFGNNAWARGSYYGDYLTLGWEAPQLKVIKDKYPNVLEMSEVERAEMWRREGLNQITENPKRFLWLVPRKVAVFVGPFQNWSVFWYRMHYLWIILFPLAIFALLQRVERSVKQQRWLLVVPFIGTLPSVILICGYDRYRFPVEPFFIVLGAVGAIIIINLIKNFINRFSDTLRRIQV